MEFINITKDNIDSEHLCCAISDKKHQVGVNEKRTWINNKLNKGHVFRKLNEKAKVFIEYSPLEEANVSIIGDNYIYIYCLWVSGKYKGKGYGKELLNYCIDQAKALNKSGVCILSSSKKKPYLSDKKFMSFFGFVVVDKIEDYELLALSFDDSKPQFTKNCKSQEIDSKELTIYFSPQCPYINNCIVEVKEYCINNDIPLTLVKIDTIEEAKSVPGIFNNYSVFYNGKFHGIKLLNENEVKKILI